jgi:hypothetical protein
VVQPTLRTATRPGVVATARSIALSAAVTAGASAARSDTTTRAGCGPDGCADPESPYRAVCGDVTCAPGYFCRGEACVPSCARRACALFEVCVDGVCAPDACACAFERSRSGPTSRT